MSNPAIWSDLDPMFMAERLGKVKPGLVVNVVDGEIVEWTCPEGTEQPTQAELEAEWEKFNNEGGFQKYHNQIYRAQAFAAEADPLFFQVQRGDIEQSVYDAKVAEIRARYPYPGE